MQLRTLIASLALLAVPALAQPVPHGTGIPTVTRLVKMFSELERGLAETMRAKDSSALDALLDPSFEMRVGNAPGVPVPRDAWVREARSASTSPRIEQMAVHDFGDVAVVSFRESSARTGAKDRETDRFVVDCWKRDGDTWKLAVRYLSDASAHGVKMPGAGATIDKRY